MGLDMYLNKVTWISKYGDKPKLKITGLKGVDVSKVTEIREEAIYWRKANHIHKWFVDNVQEGEDDCKEWGVSRKKLKELFEVICEVLASSELVDGEVVNGFKYTDNKKRVPILEKGKVMKDKTKAEELLPTQSGFFFGSYDYDEYYWNDLVETRDKLKKILDSKDSEDTYYVYRSSW